MLGDEFASSVQQVPEDEDPASAQQVMGDYYPRMAQCSVSTFTQGGASACFAAAGTAAAPTGTTVGFSSSRKGN
jgi:hypothetical protein